MQLCPTCRCCYGDEVPFCSSDHSKLTHQRPGTQLISGRYFLERLIGSGGMGEVYQARHLDLNRPCAVKLERLDREDLDPNGKVRLRREALVSCQMDHRNVVRIYDSGTNIVTVADESGSHASEELFIAMELLHGETVQKYLARKGRITPGDAVLIARQTAQGLAELHAQRVIHRDLKPANLMLTLDRHGRLVVKIIDFGAVKLAGPQTAADYINLTGTLFIGSALYASPEMCKGLTLDPRSDLYSLGLVLYEMLAGRSAFDRAEFPVLIYNQAFNAPPQLTGLPRGLLRLVNDAIQKDPARRIQTADEFVARCRELERAKRFFIDGGARIINALRENGCVPPPDNLDLALSDDEETRVAPRAPNTGSNTGIEPVLVEGTVSSLDDSGIVVTLNDGAQAIIYWQELLPDDDEDVVVSVRAGQRIRARIKGNGNGDGRLHLSAPIKSGAPDSPPPNPTPPPAPLTPPAVKAPDQVRVEVSRISERARVGLASFFLTALVISSLILIGGRFLRSLPEATNPAAVPANQPAPLKFTGEIGEEAETTIDCNLRESSSARSPKVGLAEKGSRIRILDERRNWRRIVVLQHGRDKEDPDSEDEGWIDGNNLKAVEGGSK
jgi:serine/threonine protein kinase